MIEWTLIILISVAILLFILSIFQKDRTKEVERQMENFSITLMQEIYQLKKKIRILEEELLIGHQPLPKSSHSRSTTKQQLLEDVVRLYNEDFTIEEIALKTTLTTMEVEGLLEPYLGEEPERGPYT
ncbi:hypothetical protein [Bacillus solitudinis]|uniref:hypothetical protein n=1 Tax=Bacillus solitudinis TaxID=2014074 RepID=UPI000C2303EB|nr:hypothetical protein [Bacillus solitudinis]